MDDFYDEGDVVGSEPPAVRGRGAVRRLRIAGGLAVAAALAAGLAVNHQQHDGSHPRGGVPAAASSSSPPAPPPIRIDAASAAAVAAWYSGGGSLTVSVLARDSNRIAADHIRQDFNALGSDCSQLGDDVTVAQAYTPLPDPGAQNSWAAALGHLGLGADACVDGVSNSLPAELSSGTTEMYTGSMTVLSLESQLGAAGTTAPTLVLVAVTPR